MKVKIDDTILAFIIGMVALWLPLALGKNAYNFLGFTIPLTALALYIQIKKPIHAWVQGDL